MARESTIYANPRKLIAYFNDKIAELSGEADVVESSTIIASSGANHSRDAYVRDYGDEVYTRDELSEYWDTDYNYDPVLYEGYAPDEKEKWLNETLSWFTKIDYDDLMDIAESYVGSMPKSGSWDTETQAIIDEISQTFNISEGAAKNIMIDILGWEEEMFACGDINMSQVTGGCHTKSSVQGIDEEAEPIEASWEDEDSEYLYLEQKDIVDSDGFITQYTMYLAPDGSYVMVYGDPDLYRPEDEWFDAEFDNEAEAYEWFENYNGFADDFDE